jgi:CIC family chloride channel protein
LYRYSIYEALTEQDGIHLPDSHSTTARGLTVADAMTKKVITLGAHWTLTKAVDLLKSNQNRTLALVGKLDLTRKIRWGDINTYPLVDGKNKFIGVISVSDIEDAMNKRRPGIDLAAIGTTKDIVHVHPDHTLDQALRRLGDRGLRMLPVVSREDQKRLLGVITLSDIMRAYRISGETFAPQQVAKVDLEEVQ